MCLCRKKINWLWLVAAVGVCLTGVAFGLVDGDFYWQSELGMHEFLELDFDYSSKLLWGSLGIGEYLDHEWLCNILFYLLRTPFAMKLVLCIATGVSVGLLCKSGLKRLGVLALYALLFCRVKAASFSVLFLMFEVLLLDNYKDCWRWRVGLFSVLVLWNNMHSGSVILFFLVAGAWFLFGHKVKPDVLHVAVACIALLGLTPYGYQLMLFNFSHIASGSMSDVVVDWHPLDCSQLMGWVSVAVCIWAFISEKNLWRKVAVAGICAMTLKSERFGVYLFPFLLTCDFKDFDIKSIAVALSCMFGVFGILIGLRGGEGYNLSYGDRMAGVIREGDGLFNEYEVTASQNIKGFINGAYPLCRERTLDSLVLKCYGGKDSIEKLINHYGLTRFVFCKYNMQCGFYNVTNALYDYLSERDDKYKCLYDDGMFVYFEEVEF